MKKNNYFLVARNRDTNTFKILRVYGERGSQLEKIDYATSKFKSSDELIKLLFEKERIDSLNTDLFIAYKGNKKEMKYLEVIYNSKDDRVQDLRNALVFSSNKNLSKSEEAKRIVDKFCQKMEYNSEFYNFIMNENTNLYSKFIKYFKKEKSFGMDEDSTIHNKPKYSVKYVDGAWVINSYLLIRNIVEAFNRFDRFNEKENIDYLNSNVPFRKLINNRLMIEVDSDYIDGQMNIFDYMNMQEKISDDDKMVEVMNILDYIGRDTFVKRGSGIGFNEKKFSNYEDVDLEKLKTLIKGKLRGYMYLFGFHKYHLDEANKYMMNTLELESDVRLDRAKIIEYLRQGKNLDKAYEWSKIFTKYLEKSKVYKKD